jgi:hypothetical protein
LPESVLLTIFTTNVVKIGLKQGLTALFCKMLNKKEH